MATPHFYALIHSCNLNGASPSTTKIAEEVGVSRGTVYKYLVAMNENGMIAYDGQDIQTDVTYLKRYPRVL